MVVVVVSAVVVVVVSVSLCDVVVVVVSADELLSGLLASVLLELSPQAVKQPTDIITEIMKDKSFFILLTPFKWNFSTNKYYNHNYTSKIC